MRTEDDKDQITVVIISCLQLLFEYMAVQFQQGCICICWFFHHHQHTKTVLQPSHPTNSVKALKANKKLMHSKIKSKLSKKLYTALVSNSNNLVSNKNL